jgi:hypothetical protein
MSVASAIRGLCGRVLQPLDAHDIALLGIDYFPGYG